MISEALRSALYPLGFIASFAFALRFAVQWLSSEYKKESYVPKSFWWISLFGNVLLFTHGMVQLQYHVALVQGTSSILSWRNLNLMGLEARRCTKMTVIFLLLTVISAITFSFWYLGATWFRIPLTPWQQEPTSINLSWHLLGFLGMALFASRFWIQWWQAEQKLTSYLSRTFWWLSITGCTIIVTYFFMIGDPVNGLGPAMGLIAYVRNLLLIRRVKTTC